MSTKSESAVAVKASPRSKAEQIVDILKESTSSQVAELAVVWKTREPEHLTRFLRALNVPVELLTGSKE